MKSDKVQDFKYMVPITNVMEYGPYWQADSHSAGQEIPYITFLETEGWLQCWQQPATGAYTGPDEFITTASYFLILIRL